MRNLVVCIVSALLLLGGLALFLTTGRTGGLVGAVMMTAAVLLITVGIAESEGLSGHSR